MLWLTGHWNDARVVAVKVILLHTTSLAGLRLGTRRALAQMALPAQQAITSIRSAVTVRQFLPQAGGRRARPRKTRSVRERISRAERTGLILAHHVPRQPAHGPARLTAATDQAG
jgi:hypothetical protein